MRGMIKFFLVFFALNFQLSSAGIYPELIFLEELNEKHEYEIDEKAAYSVVELGGGFYYNDLEVVIPFQPELVHKEWQIIKKKIAKRIGKITPVASVENFLWQNSATSIDELLEDAQISAFHFFNACKNIAKKTNSRISFGPENAYLIKSKKSLSRKVTRDAQEIGISEEQAVAKIGDVIRGTIITDSPDNIPRIVEEIKDWVAEAGGEVFFRNYWIEERQSGYVGIHAKLILPVDEYHVEKFILAELQIHLPFIMDGSRGCVKEREHILYDKWKSHHFDPDMLSAASKLLYLTALKKYDDNSEVSHKVE